MQETLLGLAWVALGSALGGAARFALAGLVGRRVGEAFPWGTLAVNSTGALAAGVAAGMADGGAGLLQAPAAWQFAAVGVLGSYTTVSAFSLQTLALARDGRMRRAAGNVLLSLALCLAAVAAGFAAGTTVAGSAAT